MPPERTKSYVHRRSTESLLGATKAANPETGSALTVGEIGEVCFRDYCARRGYYGDEIATAKTVDATCWLRWGALGWMDCGGYLSIAGRIKEKIIRRGEDFYRAEIERVLFTYPKAAQVGQFARGELAHFKVPNHIRIVDSCPMTITGKIQKFRTQELEAAALAEGPKVQTA